MLVIKIELWPFGSEENKREICRGVIGNTGKGDHETGEYVYFLKDKGEFYKKGEVKDFPRLKKNAWDLLKKCLTSK
jgi:hypothetical protein